MALIIPLFLLVVYPIFSFFFLFLFVFSFFSLGLRSQFDSSVIASPVVATNVDADSTTSGNSSASNSSSCAALHTPASVGTLKAPCIRKQQASKQQQQNAATLRPNSLLLGDRTMFNEVSGFS